MSAPSDFRSCFIRVSACALDGRTPQTLGVARFPTARCRSTVVPRLPGWRYSAGAAGFRAPVRPRRDPLFLPPPLRAPPEDRGPLLERRRAMRKKLAGDDRL